MVWDTTTLAGRENKKLHLFQGKKSECDSGCVWFYILQKQDDNISPFLHIHQPSHTRTVDVRYEFCVWIIRLDPHFFFFLFFGGPWSELLEESESESELEEDEEEDEEEGLELSSLSLLLSSDEDEELEESLLSEEESLEELDESLLLELEEDLKENSMSIYFLTVIM